MCRDAREQSTNQGYVFANLRSLDVATCRDVLTDEMTQTIDQSILLRNCISGDYAEKNVEGY